MKKVILTKQAPAPIGPYSQAIESGPFLFCSGQIPIDPSSGQVFTGDLKAQTELVMKNVEAVLKEAGLSFKHVVKTTIFLTNMNDFATVNEVYGKYFSEQPPARSTVAVAGLPKGVNVEVEVIAARGA
ncbi:MAG: reactive intermediate/imine deaminase [Bdellovibrio sp. CG10_big_fil_rev_8_21_14_0_10_47_8]|nr:MAG: reactive intermediate/imine deaminase [Bdellovibrio sp. CG10_big_fil_rev_8_21_14_0_10_47_8]